MIVRKMILLICLCFSPQIWALDAVEWASRHVHRLPVSQEEVLEEVQYVIDNHSVSLKHTAFLMAFLRDCATEESQEAWLADPEGLTGIPAVYELIGYYKAYNVYVAGRR